MAQGTTRGVPIDTDPTLAPNSDILVPSQSAVKGYAVPQTRTITINGVTFDLSANRSWTITAGVSSVSGTAPIASSGGATPTISISQATTSTDGYLSSTDWNTFNNKAPQSVGTGVAMFNYYNFI